VAGGADKAAAIRATLRSGLLSGLVTDETTARRVLEQGTVAAGGAGKRRRAREPS